MSEKLFIPKYEKFNSDKYPVSEDTKHEYFVRTAVEHEGQWYAADVLEGGYSVEGFQAAKSQEAAELWASVHNNYVGFSDEYVEDCLTWSIEQSNDNDLDNED